MRRPLPTALVFSLTLLPGFPAAEARPRPLPVPGFAAAAHVLPTGPGARPLVIGLHGNFDRPEWFCGAMQEIVGGRAWLLCPRGRRRRDVPREHDRYTFPSRSRLKREIAAGRKALAEKYPGRVAPGPPLLAGFSLGAIYASRFAVAQPASYPRLYLVEGAHKVWTPKNIRRFARGGGKAVLFGCGRRGCRAQSRRICKAMKKAGVWCGEVTAPGLGHSYTAPLTRLALALWQKLVAGAPGWGE